MNSVTACALKRGTCHPASLPLSFPLLSLSLSAALSLSLSLSAFSLPPSLLLCLCPLLLSFRPPSAHSRQGSCDVHVPCLLKR